jgi:outer membrane lipoprotein-sorting protein
MSAPMKILAAAALVAVATPALAQDTAPWDLRERNAYVLDMQGKMWSTQKINAQGWTMMTRRAKAVPKGTVFFMTNGRLYMASNGMFDRAGGFLAMGGY